MALFLLLALTDISLRSAVDAAAPTVVPQILRDIADLATVLQVCWPRAILPHLLHLLRRAPEEGGCFLFIQGPLSRSSRRERLRLCNQCPFHLCAIGTPIRIVGAFALLLFRHVGNTLHVNARVFWRVNPRTTREAEFGLPITISGFSQLMIRHETPEISHFRECLLCSIHHRFMPPPMIYEWQ